MVTYKICFYPGMVLPKPYYVTIEEETSDYGLIMDIFADTLIKEGADGLFDDNNELSDDEIYICGNESRRLKTGGLLNISLIEISDIVNELWDKADNTLDEPGLVKIKYYNADNEEVLVELAADTDEDLARQWDFYCNRENNPVVNISLVEVLGYEVHEIKLYAEEYGSVEVKVPIGATNDEIIKIAKEQEEFGNGIFYDRKVTIIDENSRNQLDISINDKKFLKNLLYNAIVGWYDDSLEEYKGLNDEEFIHHVCKTIGITEADYKEIMEK